MTVAVEGGVAAVIASGVGAGVCCVLLFFFAEPADVDGLPMVVVVVVVAACKGKGIDACKPIAGEAAEGEALCCSDVSSDLSFLFFAFVVVVAAFVGPPPLGAVKDVARALDVEEEEGMVPTAAVDVTLLGGLLAVSEEGKAEEDWRELVVVVAAAAAAESCC